MESTGKILNTPVSSSASVVERIINQLTEAIIAGELKPGDQIPTEMELASSLQVGRNSVREAINVLSHFGVVEIRRAEGTFVTSSFSKKMLDPMLYGLILQKDSAKDILELREVFDIGIMNVVIDLCTEETVADIRRAYGELEKSVMNPAADPQAVLDQDIAFHSVVNSSIHNRLVNEVAGYIDRITIPSRIQTMKMILENSHQKDFLNLHLGIVRMIESHESENVVAVVKEHYQYWRLIEK
jgi:GntR family transcriptional regulator, transcriptional repressor for pyruvate dehydrogenase complex